MQPRVERTVAGGDLAYKVTFHCPACRRAAVGYSAQEKATYYAMCPLDHRSMYDNIGTPTIVDLS